LSLLIIQPVLALAPNDAEYVYQTYLKQLGAESAWDISTGSRDVIVAVIDTGVDISHQDLVENIFVNYGEIPNDGRDNDNNGFIDDQYGWDAILGRGSGLANFTADDIHKLGPNHGTIVAGIIGAVGNNALGTTGVAWQTRLLPVRALTKNGDGSTKIIAQAIEYAIKMKADIINLSFVGAQTDSDLQSSLQHALEAGILVVTASGNDSVNLDNEPHFPICSSLQNGAGALLGVSAVDEFYARAPFASYGSNCVDLSALGVNLRSTRVKYVNQATGDIYLTIGGLDGTSVAAPLVAGVAALVKSALPQAKGKKISEILINTAKNIDDFNTTLAPGSMGKLLRLDAALAEAKRLENIIKQTQNFFVYKKISAPVAFSGYNIAGQLTAMVDLNGLKDLAGSETDFIRDDLAQAQIFNTGRLAVSQSGSLAFSFYPYGQNYKKPFKIILLKSGGNTVVGVMPASGGGDDMQIWSVDGRKLGQFRIFSDKIRSGYSLSKIDWNNDGMDEILVSRSDRKSDIRLYDQRGHLLKKWDNPFGGGLTLAALSDQEQPVIMAAENNSYRAQVAILNPDKNFVVQFFGTLNTRGAKTEINLVSWQDRQFKNFSRVAVVYKNSREAGVKFYSPEGILRGFFSANRADKFIGTASQGGQLE